MTYFLNEPIINKGFIQVNETQKGPNRWDHAFADMVSLIYAIWEYAFNTYI